MLPAFTSHINLCYTDTAQDKLKGDGRLLPIKTMKYDYTVMHSKRRTIALEITREAKLLIRAPMQAGKRDIEQMIDKHARWVEKHLEAQQRRLLTQPPLTPDEQEELKKRAKAVIPARVSHFSQMMGLIPKAITITGAEKRFGSCSSKNRLSFSWRLMHYPESAVDYVVVHELAHILHKNHGPSFYALIETYLPDYRDRQKLLKG